MNGRQVKISKFLSLVLRHKPATIGITLDPAGWVNIETLLKAAAENEFRFSRDELNAVVANNDKKRFAFSEDGSLIRASQGHSVEVELGYDPAIPPEFLFHGTATRFAESIQR